MPSDSVTLLVSAGLGVSVIAGLASGIWYVLAHRFDNKKRNGKLRRSQWYCNICGSSFRSIRGILDNEKVVTCLQCEERICRKRCSKLSKEGWLCRLCVKQSGIRQFSNVMQPKCRKLLFKGEMNSGRIEEIDEDLQEIRRKEKEQVRSFVERLVNAILGGNVDDASVNRIYSNDHYNALFCTYHEDLGNALTELGSALHVFIASKYLVV